MIFGQKTKKYHKGIFSWVPDTSWRRNPLCAFLKVRFSSTKRPGRNDTAL